VTNSLLSSSSESLVCNIEPTACKTNQTTDMLTIFGFCVCRSKEQLISTELWKC